MDTDDRIVQLVRIARGIEAGGHYNLSKLLWALVFSEEIRASSKAGIPRGEDLHTLIESLIADLTAEGSTSEVVAALQQGLNGLRQEDHQFAPPVYVSRSSGDVYVGERPAATPNHDDPLDLREVRAHYYLELLPVPVLLDALRSFPLTISSVIEQVADDQMDTVPAPGEWSLRELLLHLDVTQGLLIERARQILNEDHPVLQGVAAWMIDASDRTAREIFERYSQSRAETLALLAPLDAKDWWRPAYHSEFGTMTLQEHASYFARHERAHLRQLMQIVNALA